VPPPLVFLSHAGEQKRHVVDCLHTLLTVAYEVAPVFLDEHTLVPGTYNAPAMLGAVGRAPVGALPASLRRVEAGPAAWRRRNTPACGKPCRQRWRPHGSGARVQP
jgi:hypothetical protein